MSMSTLIMLICLGVGCILVLAGSIYAVVQGLGALKRARVLGVSARAQAAAIVRQAQTVSLRLEEAAESQAAAAERLQALSAAAAQLNLLKTEFDRSLGWLLRVKP
ncbi:MAG: hypothetical protein N3B14_04990 [Thermoleophilia bacterium]|nr:hypothetical protein [Thermoleophilia bacterium]